MKIKALALAFLLVAGTANAAGLLTGQTPASYSLPGGWNLIRAQDFESGCNATYENCGIGQSNVGTATRAHSGTKAVYGTYTKDGDQVMVAMYPGTFAEAYVSFYQYIDSTALFTDEFYIADWMKRTASDDLAQELILDYIWCAQNYPNNTGCKLDIQAGGNRGYSLIGTYNINTSTKVMPLGQWVQWEIHYRPNTSGNSDGFMRVYMTPQGGATETWMAVENFNLNGTQPMNDSSPGDFYLYIGGTLTRLEWSKRDPDVVGPSACNMPSECGDVNDGCRNYMGWTIPLTNPRCGAAQPNFNRYIDDIILMTTGGTTPPHAQEDTLPPYIETLNPPEGATGVPTSNRVTQFDVVDERALDNGVSLSRISAVINNVVRTASSYPPLACSGTPPRYTCSFTNAFDRSPGATVEVAISAEDLAGNEMPVYRYQYTHYSGSDNTYSTTFGMTEPILHEDVGAGSVWWNGQATGLDWTNVRTEGGIAIGTQSRVLGSTSYDDSQAVLKGTWQADQCVEGVVHAQGRGTPSDGNLSGWGSGCNREIELILRGNLSAHYARPYEILISSRLMYPFHQIMLWPGPLATEIGQFTALFTDTGDQYIVQNNDVIRACVTGNHIVVTKNGAPFSEAYDYGYVNMTGNPGIGFYASNTCDGLERATDFAWKSFTADGLLTDNLVILTGSLPNGTVGTAYAPSALLAQGGQAPYSWDNTTVLPAGLLVPVSGSGAWGTPTTAAAGTNSVTLRVTDSASPPATATASLSLTIAAAGGQTTVQSTTFADTWISSLSTDSTVNFSGSSTLRLWMEPSGTVSRQSILMDNVDMQLPALPDNVVIDSATLRLATVGFDLDGGDALMSVSVYSLSGSVPDTTTVTWDSWTASPPTISAPLDTVNVPLANGWNSFNVLSAVRTAYANRQPLHLLVAGTVGSGNNMTNRKLASVDNSDPSLRPKLDITYTQLTGEGGIPVPSKGKARLGPGSSPKYFR